MSKNLKDNDVKVNENKEDINMLENTEYFEEEFDNDLAVEEDQEEAKQLPAETPKKEKKHGKVTTFLAGMATGAVVATGIIFGVGIFSDKKAAVKAVAKTAENVIDIDKAREIVTEAAKAAVK